MGLEQKSWFDVVVRRLAPRRVMVASVWRDGDGDHDLRVLVEDFHLRKSRSFLIPTSCRPDETITQL
jgi:hypothetical protein